MENGAETVRTEIDGKEWVQEPFPYQAKCLQWLRQEFVRLEDNERKLVPRLFGWNWLSYLVPEVAVDRISILLVNRI